MMTPEELRSACLALIGTREEFPFPRSPDLSVFKVGAKLFAISALREIPLRVSLKCDPALAPSLRETYPEIIPGYHLNKRHWNTVHLDGSLSERLVLDMIEDSYDLVVASFTRAERVRLDHPSARS